jgi:hypothetical protein
MTLGELAMQVPRNLIHNTKHIGSGYSTETSGLNDRFPQSHNDRRKHAHQVLEEFEQYPQGSEQLLA